MTLNRSQIQRIIMLRGFGYSQKEIADKINYSISTVAYYLHKFKKEAEENSIDETFYLYFSLDDLVKAVYSKNRK